MIKRIITGIIVCTLSIGFIGCDEPVQNSNENIVASQQQVEKDNSKSIEDSFKKLNEAKKISIEENVFAINNSYNVYLDKEKFGTISGNYINITGDRFSFKNKDGLEIASEKQIKRWGIKLNRLAEVYNYNGDVSGYIGEEKIEDYFKIGYKFHFYDKDGNELGYIRKQYFSILDHFDIYNIKNEIVYTVDKDLTIVADKYKINVIDNKDIPVDQAIFATAILHAIEQSKNNEDQGE